MFDLPARRLDAAPIVRLLQGLRGDPPLHYAAPDPAVGGRVDHFLAPRTLARLAALRTRQPGARLLAGSTDIGLWVTKQQRDLGTLHYLGEVAELKTIARDAGQLVIGAGVALEDAWCALAAEWPALEEVGRRFAGPPVRHAGTLGGNLANGSPIGDGAPVLMALGATLVLRSGEHTRELPLDAFYVDYMKNRLEPGEFLQAVRVPLPAAGPGEQRVRAYKIGKRFDCDISAVLAALALTLDRGVVAQARFAFGGMAAVVERAAQAEVAVQGRPWAEATLQAACDALDRDFAPITDLRASAAYRRRVARSLLRRFWLETRPENPLPPAQVTVWADAWETVETRP
jgi:xanthine dehydrogenase small subunit